MSTARVDFTRGAAERIARAVRIVETGERDQAPLTFKRPLMEGGGGGVAIRVCTYSGAWNKDTLKTVTFVNVTTTPNTVVAHNVLAGLLSDCAGDRCIIAREGTAWYLIAAEC